MSVAEVRRGFEPRELMLALSEATPFSNPVKGIVLFYCYEISPRQLIGRVEFYNSAIRKNQWARTKPEPEPKYQSIFFKLDQIVLLFAQLHSLGKEFDCEGPVRDCARQLIQTRYIYKHPEENTWNSGHTYLHAGEVYWKFRLVERVIESKVIFGGGEVAYVPSVVQKIEAFFPDLFSLQEQPVLDVDISLDQIDQLDLDDPSVPVSIKCGAHKTEEKRQRATQEVYRARHGEIEGPREEEGGCLGYIAELFVSLFECICLFFCGEREDEA